MKAEVPAALRARSWLVPQPGGRRLCPRSWPGDSGCRPSIGIGGGWHGGGGLLAVSFAAQPYPHPTSSGLCHAYRGACSVPALEPAALGAQSRGGDPRVSGAASPRSVPDGQAQGGRVRDLGRGQAPCPGGVTAASSPPACPALAAGQVEVSVKASPSPRPRIHPSSPPGEVRHQHPAAARCAPCAHREGKGASKAPLCSTLGARGKARDSGTLVIAPGLAAGILPLSRRRGGDCQGGAGTPRQDQALKLSGGAQGESERVLPGSSSL